MRHFCNILICLITSVGPLAAQSTLSALDKKDIRTEAKKVIEIQLIDLLNTIALDNVSESQKQLLIYDSYLPSHNQIFTEKAVLEDDINPENTVRKAGPDMSIRQYLDNLKLYYNKSSKYSIQISEVSVGEVMQKEYPFVKVTFKILFANAHRQKTTKYENVYRVAELRADKPENRWLTLITRIGYYQPPVAIPAQEVIAVAGGPAKEAAPAKAKSQPEPEKQAVEKKTPAPAKVPEKNKPVVAKAADKAPKTEPAKSQIPVQPEVKAEEKPVVKLAEKSPEIAPALPDTKKNAVAMPAAVVALEKQVSKYKKQSTIYKALAVGGVAGAVASFVVVNGSYGKYKSQLNESNAKLDTWWKESVAGGTANGQSFGDVESYKAKPKSLIGFGSPGIYFTGVGIVAGGVFWLMGSKSNSEAKRYQKMLDQKRKQFTISPQWDASRHYTGIYLSYKF